MRNLLEKLLYFKDIHPIRFWGLIMGFLISIILLLGLIKLLLKYRSTRKTSVAQLTFSNEKKGNYENKTIERDASKRQFWFLKNKTINYRIFLIVGVIIGSVCTVLIFKSKIRIENLWVSNSEYVFGIDISHYQGSIDWAEVRNSQHPIEFVFIRATMGKDGKDERFNYNWLNAREKGYSRGAYHYYRPNENSTIQFNNYASSVELQVGDFTPILDIEMPSKFGSENLRAGVLNWLRLAEEKYGVKPIVYTGRHFYNEQLKGYIDDYPLWIASYSNEHRLRGIEWTFHQFTEKVIVKGIPTSVDGNNFKKELIDLRSLCLK